MLIAYALFGLWYRPIDGGLFSESAVAESPGLCCWGGRYGRSFDCASCIKPQDASLRMTVFGGFKVQADTAVYALFWALLAPHDPNGGWGVLLSFGVERLMRHVVERDIRGI